VEVGPDLDAPTPCAWLAHGSLRAHRNEPNHWATVAGDDYFFAGLDRSQEPRKLGLGFEDIDLHSARLASKDSYV
jgi:hypothetical protein